MIAAQILNDRAVGVRLDGFSKQLHDAYLREITGLTGQLEARVHSATPVRSGTLQQSIQSFVDDYGAKIAGKVKVIGGKAAGGKAAALEYGAHAQAAIKAHERQQTMVFGRAVAPFAVFVGAYSRTPNIQPHSFLRGPLDSMSGQILARLTAVPAEVAARG